MTMLAWFRSRTAANLPSAFVDHPLMVTGVTLCLVVAACDSRREAIRSIDQDDLSISMPLSANPNGVQGTTLVGQPQPPRREVIPTPAGSPEVRIEMVPTPAGEPIAIDGKVSAIGKMAGKAASGINVTSSKSTEVPPMKTALSESDVEVPSLGVGNIGEPESWEAWPTPETVLFITGNQHGYIEPCGCTGLENQKGGLARRYTLYKQLVDRGWPIVPLDAGNQVRRTGRQAEIKFQAAAQGLAEMKYAAVGFGPDDLLLGVGELIAVTAVDNPSDGRFISANVVLIDPSLIAQTKVMESAGRRIGTTSVLDPASLKGAQGDDIQVGDIGESLGKALASLRSAQTDFNVLLFFGSEESAADAVRQTPGFDLVVVAGGFGEPTYQPKEIVDSTTNMIVTGDKGMYTGLIGLYPDGAPIRYARVPLTHEFEDAPEMRRLMASYQNQLKSLGLEELGLKPIAHPSGEEFVGTKTCGECHKTALEIWENTPHALATEHLVNPGERSDISRHFDPECISCHVTGWNAQNYYPYVSGYLSLESTSHLTGNGCENCHGPGASHSAAEREDSGVDEAARDALRVEMRLPLDSAKERCMECHDLDNSPDFHKEDAFDDYWAEVEHYGKD